MSPNNLDRQRLCSEYTVDIHGIELTRIYIGIVL